MAGFSATGMEPAIAVALGTLILLGGGWYLFGSRSRRLLGITAVLSLLLLGLDVFKIIDLYRQANDFHDRMSDLMSTVPGTAWGGESFNFSDFLHIDPAPGLWMVAVSGLLGTVLSLFVLRRTKPKVLEAVPGQQVPPPPAAGG